MFSGQIVYIDWDFVILRSSLRALAHEIERGVLKVCIMCVLINVSRNVRNYSIR